jgi:bile acid:Na+ symporter, BASS family
MSFDISIIPTLTLATMMAALGMELHADDFARLLKEPRAVALGVGGQLLLLPCIGLALAALLPLELATAVGIVLLAACPGGTTSNMFSRYARGDVALSISLTAISSVVAPLTVPLVVGAGVAIVLDTRATIPGTLRDMFMTLIAATALPVVGGMALRRAFPTVARAVRGKMLAAATAVLVLLVIGLGVNTARAQPDVAGMFTRSSAAVVVLMASCAFITSLAARRLGLSRARQRTLVLEVGIQNINVALLVALEFLNEPSYLGPTLVYLPLMLLFGAAVVVWSRRDERSA